MKAIVWNVQNFRIMNRIPTLQKRWRQLLKIKNDIGIIEMVSRFDSHVQLSSLKLKLGHLVPFNYKGECIAIPEGMALNTCDQEYIKRYQKAFDSVLFEGYTLVSDMYHETKREFIVDPRGRRFACKLTYMSGNIEEWKLRQGYRGETIESLVASGIQLTPTEACKKLYQYE